MIEIKRGTQITPQFLRSIFTKLYAAINALDYTKMKLTCGQFFIFGSNNTESDMLTMHSDQYFKTDKVLYTGTANSYLQKYIDEINEITGE